MNDISCKKCGGDLVEINGVFYCWSCDAKYVIENGEPRLLECKLCGGDVIDCGDHYECELCGQRYKKPKPESKPEPVVAMQEKPAPEPEPIVPAQGQPAEEIASEPETAVQDPQEEEEIGWEEWYAKGCATLHNMAYVNVVISLEYVKLCYLKIIPLICKQESEKDIEWAFNQFTAGFLGKYYYVYLRFSSYKEEFTSMKEFVYENLDKSIAQFLRAIFVGTGNTLYAKMITERAYSLFSGISENSKISENIEIFEEAVGDEQKELNAMYWKEHPKKLKKLESERNSHYEIVSEYNELLKKAETANQEAEKIRAEISEVRACNYEAWNRSIRLKFFQKKEKKKLDEEMHNLTVAENNLEAKLKLRENEEKKFAGLAEKKRENAVQSYLMINEIDSELNANHYPGEEDFVEILEEKIKKTIDNFIKK